MTEPYAPDMDDLREAYRRFNQDSEDERAGYWHREPRDLSQESDEEFERAIAAHNASLASTYVEEAKLAAHKALASQWMSVASAIHGDQSAYDALLEEIARAVLGTLGETND